MRSVALTGNAASGKSTVAAVWRSLGGVVIDADAIVHRLQAPGTPLHGRIVKEFGEGIVLPDGNLDRRALGKIVFDDRASRERLNQLVHPAVERERRRLVHEARRAGADVVVSEIPLLFEIGGADQFDAVVLVDSPEEQRVERLRARGLSEATARRLVAAQDSGSWRRGASTWVIDNTGSVADLEQQARDLWKELTAPA